MPCPPTPNNPTPVSVEHTVKGCVHYLDFESIYKTYTELMIQVKDIHVSKYSRK